MKLLRSLQAASVVTLLAALASPARAGTIGFQLPSDIDKPFGQCNADKDSDCGGIQIDWDGLSFDSGNPHGALHINNLTIQMTTQIRNTDGLVKPPTGNTHQTVFPLMFASGQNAVFTTGGNTYNDIISMTLSANVPVDFVGTQVKPHDQQFTLDIKTTHGDIIFKLCSIQGSSINFDHNGFLRDVNFRFCGTLVGGETPPPPPVPEPVSLLAAGVASLGLVRTARRKLLAVV